MQTKDQNTLSWHARFSACEMDIHSKQVDKNCLEFSSAKGNFYAYTTLLLKVWEMMQTIHIKITMKNSRIAPEQRKAKHAEQRRDKRHQSKKQR